MDILIFQEEKNMSKKKFTVKYTYKDNDNLLKEEIKHFDNEDRVIDFTKSLKYVRHIDVIGKPTIVIN